MIGEPAVPALPPVADADRSPMQDAPVPSRPGPGRAPGPAAGRRRHPEEDPPELAVQGWRPSARSFRAACLACGRPRPAAAAPERAARCAACGGTMITELELP